MNFSWSKISQDMVQREKSEKANYRWPYTNPYILVIAFYLQDAFNTKIWVFRHIYIYIYMQMSLTHFLFKKFQCYQKFGCAVTQTQHVMYISMIWQYIYGGTCLMGTLHASHVCLTQLRWVVEDNRVVVICCIYITNALFVLCRQN